MFAGVGALFEYRPHISSADSEGKVTLFPDTLVPALALYAAQFDADPELASFAVERLVKEQLAGKVDEASVKNLLSDPQLLAHLRRTRDQVFAELLELYGFDRADPFAEKMLSEPEKYAMNFKAYRIFKEL